jgi:hypothetical protein
LNSEIISEKLNSFYQDYNLGDEGGNHLPYVIIEFTSFFKIYIPNWDNRRKAVLRHDIHHLLTGYKSEILGEFEIAAWEIASGCMNYFAAYLLNSGGLIAGMFMYPRPTFKAFILGCRTTNLYQMYMSDDEMKSSTIDDLKNKIGLNSELKSTNPKAKEIGKLIFHFIISLLLNFVVILFSPLLVIYNIWMYGKKLVFRI